MSKNATARRVNRRTKSVKVDPEKLRELDTDTLATVLTVLRGMTEPQKPKRTVKWISDDILGEFNIDTLVAALALLKRVIAYARHERQRQALSVR